MDENKLLFKEKEIESALSKLLSSLGKLSDYVSQVSDVNVSPKNAKIVSLYDKLYWEVQDCLAKQRKYINYKQDSKSKKGL